MRHFKNTYIHTYIHPLNGPLSGTTQVSQYHKGKTDLDFTGARDSGWQWYQLGHMQVCTSPQTDNHASTPPLRFFYRPDALPAAQATASKAALCGILCGPYEFQSMKLLLGKHELAYVNVRS